MTTKPPNEGAAKGGTMKAPGDTARCIAAARAQMELIDLLARLVLASVEAETVATRTIRPGGAHERRSHNARA